MRGFSDRCPCCGGEWEERPELIGRRAKRYEDCAFRCHSCGIGYSNSTSPAARRRITREPRTNVPVVSGNPEPVLRQALNRRNRSAKWHSFCSEASEDAVVWTMVNGLRKVERLYALVGDERLVMPDAVLLWGVPLSESGRDLSRALKEMCLRIGENADSLSEPDIILSWSDRLVFIEAKLDSPNDLKPGYRGFSLYLEREDLFSTEAGDIRESGYYELVRNWVIGARLAEVHKKTFQLVNLGPVSLESSGARFRTQISETEERAFDTRTWGRVIQDAGPLPEWMATYIIEKELRRR